jgi:hypothetical protein
MLTPSFGLMVNAVIENNWRWMAAGYAILATWIAVMAYVWIDDYKARKRWGAWNTRTR